jgi:hypothetical protein
LHIRAIWRGSLLASVAVASVPVMASAPGPQDSGAQPASQLVIPAVPVSEACVLHVWPAKNAQSSYMGWFHGGAVDGDRRGIKGYPAMHSDVLTVSAQQQLLTTIDWAQSLSAPGISVVVHDGPPPEQDDRSRTKPLIAERPACYEELLVHSVLVERAAMSSSTVRVMVIGKKWRGSDAAPETFSVMMKEPVNLGAGDNKLIEASLKDGFVASVKRVLTSKFFWLH